MVQQQPLRVGLARLLGATTFALHLADATKGFNAPAMGFNTCNVGCGNYSFPNEAFVATTAKDMVRLGLKDVGFEYVNVSRLRLSEAIVGPRCMRCSAALATDVLCTQLDDGWAAVERDAATQQQVAVKRKFPSGMRHLADTVHALGMKFGVYTALASQTCGGCASRCHCPAYPRWSVSHRLSNLSHHPFTFPSAGLLLAMRDRSGHGRRRQLRPRGARRAAVRKLDGRLRQG
jgi:hypothetical protein